MLLTRLTRRSTALVVVEHLLIVASVLTAAVIRLGIPSDWTLFFRHYGWSASVVAAVLQLCLYYSDMYDWRRLRDQRVRLVGLVQALGAACILLALLYYWLPVLVIGRGVFIIATFFILVLVAGWRLLFERLSAYLGPSERLLILGTNPAAVQLARELFQRRHELGVEIVGFVDPDSTRVGAPLLNPGIIGTPADIPDIVHAREVDRVVVSMADSRGKLRMDDLLDMKMKRGVTFDYLATVYEQYTGKIALENLRPSWFVFSSGFNRRPVSLMCKRGMDVCAALVGLIVAAPLLALVALAVKLSSPGPVLYRQNRVGRSGTVFTLVKFRSMRVDAEATSGAVWAQLNDPRVTPIGRYLRVTRLDELPQLWNVLRGQMSLVGPRPERPEFIDELTKRIPFYGQRHVIRPGLTGWAQVRYTYGASVQDAMEKLQHDLFYVKHLSIALDAFILFATLKTVLLGRGT
ncbi:MAG: TIGR03013 family PEP-CTERM/XrtA system glycosyltransferase [Luteitalea sp.]|nr:TIGR03013 family PEP-CTERM/XrtA system glycosyltransferase [Luteitalea sp.]